MLFSFPGSLQPTRHMISQKLLAEAFAPIALYVNGANGLPFYSSIMFKMASLRLADGCQCLGLFSKETFITHLSGRCSV